MKYRIISSKSVEELSAEVTKVINDGGRLSGTLVVTRLESSNKMIFSQAVICGQFTAKNVIVVDSKENLKMLDGCKFWIDTTPDGVIEKADAYSDDLAVVSADLEKRVKEEPLYAIIRDYPTDAAVASK